MDKQKQIDISRVKSPEIRKRLEICEMEKHINSGFDIAYKMQTSNFPNSIAETLYDAGYRKIPKNAVVLTMEEYEELWTHGYDDGKSFAEKFYQPLVKAQTRKETADKFARDSKQRLSDKLHRGKALHTTVFGKEYVRRIFKEVVDEIAKEITEGKV